MCSSDLPRQLVAPHHPDIDARMIPQPQNLVMQIIGRQHQISFRLEAAEIVTFFAELIFPFPLAAKTGHYEQSVLIGQIVQPLAAARDAFKPDGIQIHRLGLLNLSGQICRILTQ